MADGQEGAAKSGLFLSVRFGALPVWRGDQSVCRLIDHQRQAAEPAAVWLDGKQDLVVVLHRDLGQALGAFPRHGRILR